MPEKQGAQPIPSFIPNEKLRIHPRRPKTILNESETLPKGNSKLAYAKANPNQCPVNLASAKLKELLKVPGMGPKSAGKILKLRKEGKEAWTFKDVADIVGVGRAKLAAPHLHLKGRRC